MFRSERAARRSPSLWPARLVLFGTIAACVAGFVAARMVLAPWLVDSVSRLVHGSAAWMFAAGWATAAALPAAVWVLLRDGHRRERQLGDDPLNRPRAAHGHAAAGRGSGYWIKRLPLLPPLLLAVAFVPMRGDGVTRSGTPGSDSFHRGWQVSFLIALLAVIALFVFRLVDFISGRDDRLLRLAGPWAAAAPSLGLFGLALVTD